MNTTNLLADIKKHEGCRLTSYQDTLGVWTIGYGATYFPCDMTLEGRHVLAGDKVQRWDTINQQQAEMMVNQHLDNAIDDVDRNLPWVKLLPEPAREALYSMSFQLGISRLMKFEKMLAAVRGRRWAKAVWEGYDSRWRVQTPKRWEYMSQRFIEAESKS